MSDQPRPSVSIQAAGMDDELKRHVASKLVKMTSMRYGDKDSSSEEEKGGDPLLGGG